jgi:hypothetical protein
MIKFRVADFLNSGHKFFRTTDVNRHARGCKRRLAKGGSDVVGGWKEGDLSIDPPSVLS